VWKARSMRWGIAVVVLACAACGGTPSTIPDDGGLDGTLSDARHGGKDGPETDGVGAKDGAGGKDGGGSACLHLGGACSSPGECCSGACSGGVCNVPSCTSDDKACSTNAQCCSGTCGTGKTCTPLDTTCETLGNACKVGSDCCSKRCAGGICSPSSYCEQNGDVCTTGADCCGGICTIESGATDGVCGQPPGGASNCTAVDGTVCGGVAGPDGGVILDEAGLPSCGGACCSRLCAPYEPTGVLICQPATGCHVVGDLCRKDSDCCGSTGMPGSPKKPVTCDITAPNTVGICRNPEGCKPNGDVCKLATMSCNASCDCCAGNCETMDTCKQDKDGVPRCADLHCVDAGASCASSADCCDGLPCVPDPKYVDGGTAPPFICGTTMCVNCGACTSNADCCPGQTCALSGGSTDGICGPCTTTGPDGGTDGAVPLDSGVPHCALYGQDCKTNSDCCNGVPCSDGDSICTGGETTCTCHDTTVP
jgi:hypothetical protein